MLGQAAFFLGFAGRFAAVVSLARRVLHVSGADGGRGLAGVRGGMAAGFRPRLGSRPASPAGRAERRTGEGLKRAGMGARPMDDGVNDGAKPGAVPSGDATARLREAADKLVEDCLTECSDHVRALSKEIERAAPKIAEARLRAKLEHQRSGGVDREMLDGAQIEADRDQMTRLVRRELRVAVLAAFVSEAPHLPGLSDAFVAGWNR